MGAYRFGKHPPKVDYRTLRFKNYLTPEIAAPPATYNVLTSVYQKLQTTDPTKLFPIDGNDAYGDCTIAALAHADGEHDRERDYPPVLPNRPNFRRQ